MHRLTWGAALWLVAGTTTGCELLAGLQDKFLSDPPDASAGGDSAPTLFDASAMAGNEASDEASDGATGLVPGVGLDASVDGAATSPASPDASDDGSASGPDGNFVAPDAGTTDPSAPCAAQAAFLFCDDFDTETTVAQGWQWMAVTSDGGSMGLFAGAYTSPYMSLQIASPPTTGMPQVVLGVTVGTVSTEFRLAFDLRLDMDSLAGIPATAVAQIIGQRQGTDMELNYLVEEGSAELQAAMALDGGPPSSIALPLPPLHQWTRIVIAYDAAGGLDVYEDGQLIGSDPTATGGTPGNTQFQAGMVYQVPPGSTAILYEMDNIVFRGL